MINKSVPRALRSIVITISILFACVGIRTTLAQDAPPPPPAAPSGGPGGITVGGGTMNPQGPGPTPAGPRKHLPPISPTLIDNSNTSEHDGPSGDRDDSETASQPLRDLSPLGH